MFSDAIIEPLQKTFAFKGCKITAQKKFFFLQILPYYQDFFGIGATISASVERCFVSCMPDFFVSTLFFLCCRQHSLRA